MVKRWDPKDPDCSLELRGVLAVKTLKTSPVSVTASLEKKGGFLDASVALRNESPETLAVVPETFTATVVRPKRKILLFEFPRTVSDELLWVALNYTSPDRISTATLEAQTTTSSTKDPLSVVTQRSTGTVTYRDPLPPTERADTSIFKYAFDTAGQIRTEALRAGAIPPGGALDGHVWFTLNKILSMRGVGENVRADEVNLTIFIQNAAFEIPFVLNGR